MCYCLARTTQTQEHSNEEELVDLLVLDFEEVETPEEAGNII